LQAQLKTTQADTRPKFLVVFAKPTQQKNCFYKISRLFKKNKKRNAQPTLNDTETQYGQWFSRTVDKHHWL
jgi:hypothetical protein